MIRVNILEARTHLSRYVERGEVLVVCRHNKPVAELRAVSAPPPRRSRVAGLLKGRISWKPGTFDSMKDAELAEFDGAPVFPADSF
jgi:antitoxin (DNA-binding transcriptional repressor) of toxin-antitoxin stability system